MNKTKRIVSAIMAVCMIFSLLPAHFALATEENLAAYTFYSADGNIPNDYAGHIWRLEKAPDGETNYDYTIKISAYDMQAANLYCTTLDFDNTVVNLVDKDGKPFTGRGQTKTDFATYAKPTDKMTSNSENLNYTLVEDGMIFANDLLTELSITKKGDYYNVTQEFVVQTANAADEYFVAADWNTTVGGAEYDTSGPRNTYKFPPKEECDLLTLKFKRVADATATDGKKSIDENTFKIAYNTINQINGGAGKENGSICQDEGVLLIGFPEPANDQTVTFKGIQDASGNDLNAEINIYSDSARHEFVTKATKDEVAAAATTTPATYSATVDAGPNGKTYYYSVNVSGYNVENGNFVVQKDAGAEVEPIQMSIKTADEYDVEVIVKDADTGAALSGATVSYLGKTATTSNDAQGGTRAVIKMSAGEQEVNASMTGYTTPASPKKFTVNADNANKVEISLVPERASVNIPSTSAGTADSKATVKKLTTDNPTAEWGTEKTYTGSELSSAVSVPKGNVYEVTFTAPKYTSQKLYLKVEADGTYKFYKDNPIDVTSPTEFTDSVVEIQKLDDPYYYVEVKPGASDPTTYTAKVTLNNVEAENGTFGLQYDNKVFSLETFTMADGIKNENVMLPSATGSMLTQSDDTTAVTGYHAFSWIVDGMDADGNQAATSLSQDIATYTFKLKDNKTAKDVTSAAFTVMPFDKTEAGLDYIKNGNDLEESREFLDYLWRYVDANNDTPLARRLSKDKATLNGFHQVYVPPFDGNYPDDAVPGEPGYNSIMTDVRTQFDFTPERGALQFVVTDEDNIALDDAEVKIYEEGNDEPVATLKTDETGIVTYPVDGDKEYKYVVSLPGYWDVPEKGLNDAAVEDKKTTVEYITMEKKIYHEPKLEADASVTNADHVAIAGDKVAYNGRDFFFDIRPELGWKIENPVFEVSVKDENGDVHTYYSEKNDFTNKDGMYMLAADKIVGLPLPTSTTPDPVYGYKSDDITVKLTSATISKNDEKFTVTASTIGNGTVTYAATSDQISYPAGSTPVKQIILNEIDPTVNNKTGTFTFEADKDHFIEKVVINGVEIDYKNMHTSTLSYSFGAVTMDCDITVTFWDGNTESNDAVLTLVVGPNGAVEVTAPTTAVEQNITNTRRAYKFLEADLAPSSTFEFTAASIPTSTTTGAKVLVETSVNGAPKQPLSQSGGKYIVPVNQKDNIVVYVTFDDSTAYVTSYVKEGLGDIDPVGVLIKKKHDSVTVNTTAETNDPTNKKWSASSLDVDGTSVKNTTTDDSKFSYTVDSIMGDMSMGAIFTEATFSVTGYVDLSQNSNLTNALAQTFAFVTFTRKEDGKVVTTNTTTDRKDAYFTVDLPKGTWDVTVKKSGYINYTITGYTVEGTNKKVTFGQPKDGGDVKKITPFIGNTNGSGRTVSFADVGVVGNGLRNGVTGTILQRADVDDDGVVKADSDMMYIKANYGQRSVTETYDQFIAKSAPTEITKPAA